VCEFFKKVIGLPIGGIGFDLIVDHFPILLITDDVFVIITLPDLFKRLSNGFIFLQCLDRNKGFICSNDVTQFWTCKGRACPCPVSRPCPYGIWLGFAEGDDEMDMIWHDSKCTQFDGGKIARQFFPHV